MFQDKAGQLSAPRFVTGLRDYHCEFELGRSYFDARIEPASDGALRVEWLHDGQPIKNANRVGTHPFVCLHMHI